MASEGRCGASISTTPSRVQTIALFEPRCSVSIMMFLSISIIFVLKNLAEEADQVLDAPRRKRFEKHRLAGDAAKAMRHAGRDYTDLIRPKADGVLIDHDLHLAREHQHGLLLVGVMMNWCFTRMRQPDLIDTALQPRGRPSEVALKNFDLGQIAPLRHVRHR